MQSFTVLMPLLTATSAFGLGEDTGILLNSVIYTVSVASVQYRAVIHIHSVTVT